MPITLTGDERKEYYKRLLDSEDMGGYVSPNRIKDVPQGYKDYVAENYEKMLEADERGKLAWHFAANREWWERQRSGNLVEEAHSANNESLFVKYRDDPDYRGVEFNTENGGLKATHIRHSFDKYKGWYETEVQDIGFRHGHSVILQEEIHTRQWVKNTEGLWDGMTCEIAGAETCTSQNVRNALKHCAAKPGADVAIIFFPNECDLSIIHQGIARYNGLRNTNQWRKFSRLFSFMMGIYYKKPPLQDVTVASRNKGRVS